MFAGRGCIGFFPVFCNSFRIGQSIILFMADRSQKLQVEPAGKGDLDESVLVRRFNTGDDAAFAVIVESHRHSVAALANRLLGWPGDVDDVMQDVFLSAMLGLKKFRGDCTIKTWLFRITVNKCRTRRYRRMLKFRALRALSKPGDYHTAAADKRVMDDEKSQQIRRAVKGLPMRYREPVVLRYLNELSSDEAANVLGITRNALNVRLNRARTMLKDQLGEIMEQ